MTQRIVIKLGGATLFREEGFIEVLSPLLNRFAHEQVFVMVGGGDWVEGMRTIHRIYPHLDPVEIHWRCVELLETSLAVAREVMPLEGCIETSWDRHGIADIDAQRQQLWLSVRSFYDRGAIKNLPSSWQPKLNWETTSDALAWLAGKCLKADRVVLMKQCNMDPSWSLDVAVELGIVDPEIVRLAALDTNKTMAVELV